MLTAMLRAVSLLGWPADETGVKHVAQAVLPDPFVAWHVGHYLVRIEVEETILLDQAKSLNSASHPPEGPGLPHPED